MVLRIIKKRNKFFNRRPKEKLEAIRNNVFGTNDIKVIWTAVKASVVNVEVVIDVNEMDRNV